MCQDWRSALKWWRRMGLCRPNPAQIQLVNIRGMNTWRIKSFLFPERFTQLHHIPPESHRAGQSGPGTQEWRGWWWKLYWLYCTGWDLKMSSWRVLISLRANAQPHFAWPPSPTAMMATVAGTNCYCGTVYCVVQGEYWHSVVARSKYESKWTNT